MSKITLKEFKDVTDLFLSYYKARAAKREDGWIEKAFKKEPKLKNVWKDFDRKIKDAERQTDRTAVPYLKQKGIDIDIDE